MRLVEDSLRWRVFEKQGYGARHNNPSGTIHNEAANIVVLLAVIALVAASFAHGGIQSIQQGNTSNGVLLSTLMSTLIFLIFVSGIVIYLGRLQRNTMSRTLEYIFDLSNNALFIVDAESTTAFVSSDKYPYFVIEITPACYRVIVSGMNVNAIYESYGPPPPEFISTLTAIGLRKVDKLKRN